MARCDDSYGVLIFVSGVSCFLWKGDVAALVEDAIALRFLPHDTDKTNLLPALQVVQPKHSHARAHARTHTHNARTQTSLYAVENEQACAVERTKMSCGLQAVLDKCGNSSFQY